MARILQVIRVRDGLQEVISVADALVERVRSDAFICHECGGKITLVKASINGMVAHGEHGRGQHGVFCSLKDLRLRKRTQ